MLNKNPAHQVEFTECKSYLVITDWHQTHAAAIQSTERVPNRLQSATFRELLLLHILHNACKLFLLCRSWWTVSRLTPTAPFSYGVWPVWMVCRCMVYMDLSIDSRCGVKYLTPREDKPFPSLVLGSECCLLALLSSYTA